MPNTENINKLIETLRSDQKDGRHFIMSDFGCYLDENKVAYDDEGKYHHCNTAMCLAGWANHLRLIDENPNRLNEPDYMGALHEEDDAASWLGINRFGPGDLFRMENSPVGLGEFDDLPKEIRYAAGIRVLEILRDTNEIDWRQALKDAGYQF